MADCGCSDMIQSCTCVVRAGLGVTVSGSGAPEDPLVLSVERQYLAVADSSTADMRLTGNGDTDDPYFLSISAKIGATGDAWTRWRGSEAEYQSVINKQNKTLYVTV